MKCLTLTEFIVYGQSGAKLFGHLLCFGHHTLVSEVGQICVNAFHFLSLQIFIDKSRGRVLLNGAKPETLRGSTPLYLLVSGAGTVRLLLVVGLQNCLTYGSEINHTDVYSMCTTFENI